MPLSLAQLTTPKTPAQIRQQLLDGLMGRGVVTRIGAGSGTIVTSGTPVAALDVRIQIQASGEPGSATYAYSFDKGSTWSATAVAMDGGSAAIGSSGVSVSFVAGPVSTTPSFVAGDIYTFSISVPSFPAMAWQPGSVPRTLIDLEAMSLADLAILVTTIARGGFVTSRPGETGASGPWLDLQAENVYQLTRNPAVATRGVIRLVDAAGAGPYSIVPGQLWVADTVSLSTSTPYRFSNVNGGTLPKGGSLTLLVAAEAPGAAYNRPSGAITTLITSLPGVTINNPDPGSGSWITVQGTDEESDLATSTRCQGKWPSIGIGATDATYDYWARTASAEVTRTRVQPSSTVGGQVDIWLAGASGPVSAGAVTDVQAYVGKRLPLGTIQNTVAATGLAVTIAGTVYVTSAFLAAAQSRITSNLLALIRAAPIGGTVYLSQVVESMNSPQGVRNSSGVTLNGSGSDLVLGASQVATGPALSLSFVAI